MSLVLLAYHELGHTVLRTLLELEAPVAAVFTYEDDPEENCWFGSVGELARSRGIPTHITERINDPEWVETIEAIAPDVILSAHYRHMVKKKIRSLPRLGAFNLHASLLPKFRGRSPINWQLVEGAKQSGLTLHHMVARADAGDIVDREAVAVGPDDTALDLYKKLLPAAEAILRRQTAALLDGSAPRVAQNEDEATLYGGRTPEDGRIDWRWGAGRIHDLVRAVAEPWPGAFCDTPAGRLAVWRTALPAAVPGAPTLEPGAVWRGPGEALLVGTGDGLIELVQIDSPRGLSLEPGATLVSPTPRAGSSEPKSTPGLSPAEKGNAA